MQVSNVISLENKVWDIFTVKDEYGKCHPESHRSLHTREVKHDIHDPIVSKYMMAHGSGISYPENRRFAVCLTHDVDDVYPRLYHTLLSSLHCAARLDHKELKCQLSWKLKGRNSSPYMNFKEIMRLEEDYGARSSFYFLSSDEDVRRFRYRIESLKSEMGDIVDRGWEVGLHGDLRAYIDPGALIMQKSRLEKTLGKKVIGYRNHYLRFKVPDTWELLARTGFRYDSTLGYNNAVGFRNGMCHPFRPYNLDTGKEIKILEIPLTIMDSGMFWNKTTSREAWETAKRIIGEVERCNGVLTLLWHNYVFGASFRKDWARLYDKILSYCRARNAWMTSGEEMCRWWNDNHVG